MARFIKKRDHTKGMAPGSLVFIGSQKMSIPKISLVQYDENQLEEFEQELPIDLTILPENKVNWINLYGVHDQDVIGNIGKLFGIHSLHLEDLMDTDQRPKYFEGDTYNGFILKMLSIDSKTFKISSEQVTFLLGENYLITLQEQPSQSFQLVRDRIRNKKGRIRSLKNDYLAYALFDAILDNYLGVIETLGSKIEDLEPFLFETSKNIIPVKMFQYKMELNLLRKYIRPVKEMMIHILKSDNLLFDEKNIWYLRDLNDLITQASDSVELYNSIVNEQLSLYNTTVGNRMNEVMKVLTMFAAIFIPLTFMAGVYGMNFKYLPELNFKYGYLYFWIVVLITTIVLVLYFRRKKWL